MWPHFGERTETFAFIKNSLAIRKEVLATVVEAEMVDCYVDENFYIVKKETEEETLVLGITKSEVGSEEVAVAIDCLADNDQEIFENLYTGAIYKIENGMLDVIFNAKRDPVLLKHDHK